MNIAMIGCGGIGDCMLSYQCGHYAEKLGNKVFYFHPVRNQVFDVLNYFFSDATQIDESYDEGNQFEKDEKIREQFKEEFGRFDELYWICPDLLGFNSHAFNYNRYLVSPSTVASTRLLTEWRMPDSKTIFCALNSSTPEYQLGDRIGEIIYNIAIQNPSYRVLFNNLSTWAGKKINNGNLDGLPNNVFIENNMSFNESLLFLRMASYVVSVDCGIYHISKHLGIDTLLLDARLGYNSLPWLPRWREFGLSDSIPDQTSPEQIGKIVRLNLNVPQTTLIPRHLVLNDCLQDDEWWRRRLFLKRY